MSRKMISDVLAHLERISGNWTLKQGKVVACMAGGTAVAFHTGDRMSDDIDIAWSHRVLISLDEQSFMTEDAEGSPVKVTVDAGFSDSIGLFHPDWKEDAMVIADYPQLTVKVITPVDLIISKIGRFIERDRDDIRQIATALDIDPEAVRLRAEEALEYYVGSEDYVRTSLKLALDILEQCRHDQPGRQP